MNLNGVDFHQVTVEEMDRQCCDLEEYFKTRSHLEVAVRGVKGRQCSVTPVVRRDLIGPTYPTYYCVNCWLMYLEHNFYEDPEIYQLGITLLPGKLGTVFEIRELLKG